MTGGLDDRTAGGGGRPLVGLLAATEELDGVPHHAVRDVYVRALTEVAGVAVVVLPVGQPAPLHRLDGLVLGGHQSNVRPERYGAAPVAGDLSDPPRDETALSAAVAAVRAGLPLFGICRGLQELNVAFGGTLRALGGDAHREDERLPRDEQYLPAHPVAVRVGGPLHALLGSAEVGVNTLHGQAVDRVGAGLLVEATAPDGVVEALSVASAPDRPAPGFALAVQWHPEWHAATDPVSRALFAAFGDACRGARREVVAGVAAAR